MAILSKLTIIVVLFSVLIICVLQVPKQIMTESFICQKQDVSNYESLIMPLQFDPTSNTNKLYKKTDVSNVEFVKLLGIQKPFLTSLEEYQVIRNRSIFESIKNKCVKFIAEKYPALAENAYILKFLEIKTASTNNVHMYAELICVYHMPSAAFAKAMQIKLLIDIINNTISEHEIKFKGNVLESNIELLTNT